MCADFRASCFDFFFEVGNVDEFIYCDRSMISKFVKFEYTYTDDGSISWSRDHRVYSIP